MVGLVLVSHIVGLAEGAKELVRLVARDCPVEIAAGTDDGRPGTSLEKIVNAVERADQGDGVLVVMDLGSSVMTTEMALDMLDSKNVQMLDCPFVEGAIVAATAAERDLDLEAIKTLVKQQRNAAKF